MCVLWEFSIDRILVIFKIPAWCTSSSPEPATSGELPQVCPPTCCDVRVIVRVVNIINVITIDIVAIATVLNISALISFMVIFTLSWLQEAQSHHTPDQIRKKILLMGSWLFWWRWWWCLGKCHTWGNIEAPLSFSFSLVMFECVQNLLIKLVYYL